MRFFLAAGAVVFSAGLALGDSVLENGGAPTFTPFPVNLATGLNSGTPYWDNYSGDFGGSNTSNIGYCLTGAGDCGLHSSIVNVNPNQYLSGTGSGGTNNAPAAFNLVHTTNSLIISVLGSFTGDPNESFGIYDASLTGAAAVASEITLFGPGVFTAGTSVNASGVPFANIGFFDKPQAGMTWFSQSSLNNSGSFTETAGHQHFALFTIASNPNVFYLGMTDWLMGNGGEGNGDYNDIIIQINASPEPATFMLIGAGLLGLGYTRFSGRSRK